MFSVYFVLFNFFIDKVKNKRIKNCASILAIAASIYGAFFIASESFNKPKLKVEHQNSTYTTQGCCSHHSGICGCKNGHSLCCDNTVSNTCTCYYSK